ncbi:MAG: hypothetical protein ACRC28_02790 [Clostridium sp.]|uniref:hypothetical protein n=1 Tax=Clostridium sp. TaxID=1506 RepID=UPI003F3C4ABC
MRTVTVEYKLSRKTRKPMALEWPILKLIQNKNLFSKMNLFEVLEEKFMIKNSKDIIKKLLRKLIKEEYIINSCWYMGDIEDFEEIEVLEVEDYIEGIDDDLEVAEVIEEIEEIDMLEKFELSEKGNQYITEGLSKELDEKEKILAHIFYINNIKEKIFLSINGEMMIEIKNKEEIKENTCILSLENENILIMIRGSENKKIDELEILTNKIEDFEEIATLYSRLQENQENCMMYEEIFKKIRKVKFKNVNF